ncbi:putative proline-rich receptor-like protein kinase PERK3 [Iris pallida]|uniref:Proline-rich receptor-like protein kinase PERK3 n=1 Tax=Iris pallida TaxID=29817 RepID=A0AAX6EET7_IRIPA|nr:putative proline-rich receptor-like protein kinase PERK3 [Iris pallida]KAJ6809050.1 putative proline-rich receptor-like protein kinase PERK3 [Iris pallida]
MRIQTEGAHRTANSERGGSTTQGRRSRRTELRSGSPTRRYGVSTPNLEVCVSGGRGAGGREFGDRVM